MPFALIIIGLVLVVTGVRDTYAQFGSMVAADFTGFVWFAVAIGGVGALGSVPEARSFSHIFMALILVSLILSNSGVFTKATQALQGAKQAVPGGKLPT